MAASGPPDEPPRRRRTKAVYEPDERGPEPEPPRPTRAQLRLAQSILYSRAQPQLDALTKAEFEEYKRSIDSSMEILRQEQRWVHWNSINNPGNNVPAPAGFIFAPTGLELELEKIRRKNEKDDEM